MASGGNACRRAVLRGPMMTGAEVEAGASACLALDRALFRMVGIEPDARKIVVLKSAVHFRADFGDVMTGCVLAKSPGPVAFDPAELPWTKPPRSIDPRA